MWRAVSFAAKYRYLKFLYQIFFSVSGVMFGLRTRTIKSPTVAVVSPTRPAVRAPTVLVSAEEERWRLDNLGPAPGSRKRKTRKGRGHAAGQVWPRHRPQRALRFPQRIPNFKFLRVAAAQFRSPTSSACRSRDVGVLCVGGVFATGGSKSLASRHRGNVSLLY